MATIPGGNTVVWAKLDDEGIKGFLVEAVDVGAARDISSFGGWRAFMAEKVAV